MTVNQSNVLNVRMAKTQGDERHLCPLQIDVIERGLVMWSNPGDTILDPMMGSGTTGKMAIKLGRHFIGMECSPEYFAAAQRRIDEAIGPRPAGAPERAELADAPEDRQAVADGKAPLAFLDYDWALNDAR
jgi:DNA modification methylase